MAEADAAIDAVAPQDALAAIWRIVDELNGYLTEQAPWKVAKDESLTASGSARILDTAAEGLRVLAVAAQPGDAQGVGGAVGLARGRGDARRAGRPAHRRRRDLGPAADRDYGHQAAEPVPAHRGCRRGDGRRWRGRTRRSALPFPVVDNHCHLDIARKAARRIEPVDEALDRAAAVGVTRIVQVGCDLSRRRAGRSRPLGTYAVRRRRRRAAPQRGAAARRAGRLDDALAEIDATGRPTDTCGRSGRPGSTTSAPGRTGATRRSSRSATTSGWPSEHDRTLVIHDRDAHADVLRVLDEEGVPERTVMHCFSGDGDFAQACVERGAYLSFAGTVTFKNAENVRDGAPTSRRGTESSSRPMRRSSHPSRFEAVRTRLSSFR